MKFFRRILVATDFTDASEGAVKEAVEMARENGAELLIAHAYARPNAAQADAVAAGVYEEWDQNLRGEVERRLQPLVENARRRLVNARLLALPGAPHRAIAGAAGENNVDLVVIGARSRAAFPRLFRFSMAGRLVSTAPCPVMIVQAALPREPRARRVERLGEFRASRPGRGRLRGT